MSMEQILYDLIVHEEWIREPVIINQEEDYFWQYRGSLLTKLWKVTQGSLAYLWQTLKTQFRYQASFGCPPVYFIYLVNQSVPWAISLSVDGNFVAVLQDDVIEMRASSDEFNTVIAKCKVENDSFPQWRRMVWNDKSTLLVYSNSFGDVQIFDIFGSQKCHIPQLTGNTLNVSVTLSTAIAYLQCIAIDDENWDNLLYTTNYQGYMNIYFISESNGTFEKKSTFSFVSYHPYGLSAIVHDPKDNLFIVAGNYGKEPFESDTDPCHGSHSGLSVWRLTTESPYLALMEDRGKGLKKHTSKEILRNYFTRRKNDAVMKHGIYKMCLSHDSLALATLHIDGRLSLWQVPSMKLKKTWHKSEQPNIARTNEGFGNTQKVFDFKSNIVDITWWSNKELILATGNGDVTISSIDNLQNLLGEFPERFDSWPSLSHSVNGHVLVLECEKIIEELGGKKNSQKSSWLSDEHEEDDDEEGLKIKMKLKEATKQMLFFLTEAERFQPAIRKPKALTNTFRLLCLKSTTPEELYARKIEEKHYGEALELAQRFDLNTDLVYQRQWHMKPVSKITIHDYLTKIKDRYWVLDECLLCIPDDFDSTEQLLKYGLIGTSWSVMQNIDQLEAGEILTNDDRSDTNQDDEDQRIFHGTLSPKQKQLCKYRWQLLQYLDRLSTYEVILGGTFKARDKFSSKYFKHFRSCNIVHQAVEFARDDDAYALEHLFSYYGNAVLPHWLPILSNFPETADVADLEIVVPEIGEIPEDPEILPWLEKHHRDKDWVEQENVISQIVDVYDNQLGEFIYEERPDLLKFKNCDTKVKLEEWFTTRMFEIDETSRQVDISCDLIDLGIKRGLDHLKKYKNDLETLKILTYKINIDSPLTLKHFRELDELSKIRLLMSKTTDERFIRDYKLYLMPYLNKIKKPKEQQKLLHEFFIDLARTDLTCCLKLLERCVPSLNEPLIADVAEIMKLAIACIYACKRDDQLNLAFSIVECLPSREEEIISPQIEELHCQLDKLELLLSAAEILEYHLHPQTITYINETKSNEKIAMEIIEILIKNNLKKPTNDLNVLLKHLIKLVKVYSCISITRLHKTFAKELLQSESKQNIKLAEELLTTSKACNNSTIKKIFTATSTVLNYVTSMELIVDAAKLYFDSASQLSDSFMGLARLCLSLVQEKPASVQNEIDLIDALKILNDFNIKLLPLQVRLFANKLELIDMCLQEKQSNYKKIDQLLSLGELLKICGEDHHERIGQIKLKIAEIAFENGDYNYCAPICHQLVEQKYEQSWSICRKMGEENNFSDHRSRKMFLSFALTYCPMIHLEAILNSKTLLETQILYEVMGNYIDDGEDEEGTSEIDGATQSILKSTTEKTKQILATVKDTKWLTKAIIWSPQDQKSSSSNTQNKSPVTNFKQAPFYNERILDDRFCEKFIDTLMNENDDRKNEFFKLLLRSQKLSERRGEGEVTEDTNEAVWNLASKEYDKDSLMCLAYMMSITKEKDLEDMLNSQSKNIFYFIFYAYFYALRIYFENNEMASEKVANMYFTDPKELICHVLMEYSTKLNDDNTAWRNLVSVLTKLLDLQQAHVLQNLGKGVDIERFAMDDEYKKETILGLAMNTEDELINVSLSLADKYDVPIWDVMLAFAEFLFVDSGIKAKEVREHLSKWNVESILKQCTGPEVFTRLKDYVYPEINGKDHNMLLLFYVFSLNVTSPEKIIQGTFNLDFHVKLLKKIKAAAPSINYKELVHGDFPLDVIKGVVVETNVHLLAKIASKIPKNNGTFLTSNKVFLAYAKKSFWSPEKLSMEKSVDWLHRFEVCQKIFSKLKIMDVLDFADFILYPPNLPTDVRIDIANRLLKYSRQKKSQVESTKKEKEVAGDSLDDHVDVINQLESILTHLKRLQSEIYVNLLGSSEEKIQDFAKQYDESKGQHNIVQKLCTEMFEQLVPVKHVEEILELHGKDVRIKDCFCDALQGVLKECEKTGDPSQFEKIINTVKQYNNDGGNEISISEILPIVRQFCSEPDIQTGIKTSVLHLVEELFKLTGEDVELLMYFQSNSIIRARWDVQIVQKDLSTYQRRYDLFALLLGKTESPRQLSGLDQLLSSWPGFDVWNQKKTDFERVTSRQSYENPWFLLLQQIINLKFLDEFIGTLSNALRCTEISRKNYMGLYNQIKQIKKYLLAVKLLLHCQDEEIRELLVKELNEMQLKDVDEELVKIILKTQSISYIMQSTLYTTIVRYLVENGKEMLTREVVNEQKKLGLFVEAGSLLMMSRPTSQSFHTLSNALHLIKSTLFS